MIKNFSKQIVQFLFSIESRQFTLEHFDVSFEIIDELLQSTDLFWNVFKELDDLGQQGYFCCVKVFGANQLINFVQTAFDWCKTLIKFGNSGFDTWELWF